MVHSQVERADPVGLASRGGPHNNLWLVTGAVFAASLCRQCINGACGRKH